LDAFIEMPPAECGVGYPTTYQYDIKLIGDLSMMAVLTGRLGDGATVRVTYPAAATAAILVADAWFDVTTAQPGSAELTSAAMAAQVQHHGGLGSACAGCWPSGCVR
jgi:hypothetical protein